MSSKVIIIKDKPTHPAVAGVDIPLQYSEYIKEMIISSEEISKRLKQVAEDIHRDYKGKDIYMLCILKGAEKTFSEIISNLNNINTKSRKCVGITLGYIRISSYINTLSTDDIQINPRGFENMTDKNVLIVEDIIDTGKTMTALIDAINKLKPKSVKVVSLLIKEMKNNFHPNYIGFSIPEKFVIGYGLDYNERFRELPNICVLNKKGIEKFKQ
jgi:hypoxanthine phosphoribosyltransferase